MGSVGTENGNLWIIKYLRSSHGISTHSQKLSVPSKIELSGLSRKKLKSLILLHAIHWAYILIPSFFKSQFKLV